MVDVLNYKNEIIKAMNYLAEQKDTIFLGQTVACPGSIISNTLTDIPIFNPKLKRLELPVAEELQVGQSIGLALAGFVPISIFPRVDFLLCAVNQLSNHLDVLDELTSGQFQAHVIIRTIVGTKKPLDAGCQHCRDHTEVFKALLQHVQVIKLTDAKEVMPAYKYAYQFNGATLIVELAELY